MITVAFGPVTKVPSWGWVGADTARALSRYFNIVTFKSQSVPPKAQVIVVVKQPPQLPFIRRAQINSSKIIYCPIDYFERKSHLREYEYILKQCSMILSHAESLNQHFYPHAPTYNIEHHGKYTLPKMASYKEDGYILWIGGYQFVPYLLKWLEKHPLPLKLKLLTDYKNKSAVGRARSWAGDIGVQLDTSPYDMHEWSEELQAKMMHEAKAAIDIKGRGFMQMHKPATKAQKFISSGVPFAVNDLTNSYKYLKKRKFNICTPLESDRWLSKEYWKETRKFGTELRPMITIENIALQYRNYIKKCLEDKDRDAKIKQNKELLQSVRHNVKGGLTKGVARRNIKGCGGRKILKKSKGLNAEDIKKLK